MRPLRFTTREQRSSLKIATGNLLTSVGGAGAAETITRVKRSQLYDYANLHNPDFMPVDVLVDLIGRGRQAHLLREIALLAGYRVVLAEPVDETELAAAIAEGAREAADVPATFLDSLADGVICPDDARRVEHEAEQAAEKMGIIARIAGAIARRTPKSSPSAPALKGEGPPAAGLQPPSGRGGREPRRRKP